MKYKQKLQAKTKQSQETERNFFGNQEKQFFFDVAHAVVKLPHTTNAPSLQAKPSHRKPGRVVRVEHVDKFRRVPPGAGAYSLDEYKEWQRTHPKAKTDTRAALNGVRNDRDPGYSFKELWQKGYYYARLIVEESGTEIEVWLNDEGDGEELWVYRKVIDSTT